MNNEVLISVIMPVYNAEAYLDEAIQSILKQTYNNFEFIIINDGSTDKSLELIKEYEKEDKRIILISRENRGLVASLNEGIEKSNGKYIARMDADDISLPTRFEEQIRFMEKNKDIGICGTWVEVFGENRKAILWKMPINDIELIPRLLFSVTFIHPSVMMKKDLFDKYNLRYNKDYETAEDYKMWLDCSKYTKFGNIPKKLFLYRYLETSVSRIADNAKDEKRYKIISSIFCEVLAELGIVNNEKENKLHFIITYNEKIEKTNIHVNEVILYINKILDANKEKKLFNQRQLKQYLYKKVFIIMFYKIKTFKSKELKNLFNKYFWYGLLCILDEKFRMKYLSWNYN